MKRFRMFPLMLVLVCVLGLYGVALSGGGEPCPGCCDNPPAPTKGQFLYGTFTAARDKSACGNIPSYAGYDVQMVLRHRLNQVHLFSFHTPLGTGDLCGYDASEFETAFVKFPCALEVGQPFGFDPAKYFPVIHEIFISKKDFCVTPDEMIHGLITIRLVPINR